MADSVNDKDVAEAILGKKDVISFTLPQSWWGKLLHQKPKIEEIEITNAKLGTLVRCSELLSTITIDEIKQLSNLNSFYILSAKHCDTIVKILCWAWWNREGSYPKKYENVIRWLFTTEDMQKALMSVIMKLDVGNFIQSIITVQTMKVMSLPDQRG